MSQSVIPNLTQVIKPVKDEGQDICDSYKTYYDNNYELEKRNSKSAEVNNIFYDIVTDFYEYGWGTSFHFCPMRVGESFAKAAGNYEDRLALKLALKPGVKCLDVGCGVGGPGRNIANLSGASITGINCNKYQLSRCNFHAKLQRLEHLCNYIEGDFNNMPIPDNTYDAAFALESTCHSGGKKVYGETYRVLKPGSKFAFYEWVLTDKYDPNNKEHVKIKDGILIGNGLPDLQTPKQVIKSLTDVGFKILEHEDIGSTGTLPWYHSLQGRWSLSEFKSTPLGMFMSHCLLWVLETIRLSPKGSVKVHALLVQAAKDLIKSGELGIFTPCYLVVCEKPLH